MRKSITVVINRDKLVVMVEMHHLKVVGLIETAKSAMWEMRPDQ